MWGRQCKLLVIRRQAAGGGYGALFHVALGARQTAATFVRAVGSDSLISPHWGCGPSGVLLGGWTIDPRNHRVLCTAVPVRTAERRVGPSPDAWRSTVLARLVVCAPSTTAPAVEASQAHVQSLIDTAVAAMAGTEACVGATLQAVAVVRGGVVWVVHDAPRGDATVHTWRAADGVRAAHRYRLCGRAGQTSRIALPGGEADRVCVVMLGGRGLLLAFGLDLTIERYVSLETRGPCRTALETTALAVSRDGTRAAAGARNGTLAFCDFNSGAVHMEPGNPAFPITSVACSGDGVLWATTTAAQTSVAVWSPPHPLLQPAPPSNGRWCSMCCAK